MIRFANGSTAVHTVTLGAMRPGRSIWVQGTKGELEGWVGDGILSYRKYNKETSTYTEEQFNFRDTQ